MTSSTWLGSREQRCPTGFARILRDGDWVVRGVEGTLDDETHARMLADVVAELRRSERSSERALILVDLEAASEPTSAEQVRQQKFHDMHARLLREHTAAIAFVAAHPLSLVPPPCRWRVFTEATTAITWLEEQARANGMRGLPRRLRALLTGEQPSAPPR